MKLLFLISGLQTPASRFRVLQYIPHLEALGHECVIAPSRPPKYQGFPLIGTRASEWPRRLFRLWDALRAWPVDYDVVFLERELFSTDFVLLERLFRRIARKLILDVDDAIFLLHPRKFDALVDMSDAVIAGNRLLAERIRPRNPNTVIIPTVVDLERYPQRNKSPGSGDRPVIGWTGLASNIPFLEIVQDALRELATRHDFELRIIAESDAPLRRLNLQGVPVRFVRWSAEKEIDDLQRFDIGIMPLPDDEWSRHKCGLKLIQYLALGIPGVASPVGVNAEIVDHGRNGFLASSTAQWSEVLESLLTRPDQHRAIGAAGRATVEERYSLQAAFPLLLRTLEDVAAGRELAAGGQPSRGQSNA